MGDPGPMPAWLRDEMTLDHEIMTLLCEAADGRVAVFDGTMYRQTHISTEAWPFTDADYRRFELLLARQLIQLVPGPEGVGIKIDATDDGRLAALHYRNAGGQL